MKKIILFSLTAFAVLTAQAAPEIPAGCAQARNFSAEAYLAWLSTSTTLTTTTSAALSPNLPIATHADVQLSEDVTNPPYFMGYVRFHATEAGDYSVATDSYLRFDLSDLADQRMVSPVDFQKVHDCGTVGKTMRFHLDADHDYALRISYGEPNHVQLLVWSFATR